MILKKAKSLNQSYFVYNNELDSKELIIQSLYWREKIKNASTSILLDVDAFEDLNELYGFINAEEVLKELSNILKEFEKTHDVAAYRLSGDIFTLTNISNFIKIRVTMRTGSYLFE